MALTQEQLAVRATGLGGTDMVAILGLSEYRSPIDVYLEKRHQLGLPINVAPPEPFMGNERTEWGHILEPFLADRYAQETGMRLIEPTTFRHPDVSWLMGTPDRLVFNPAWDDALDGTTCYVLNAETGEEIHIKNLQKLWEGKSHGFFGAKEYDLEAMQVPDDKRIQVAQYMALTGCQEADLSALIDTHLYRVFHIPHDQEVEDYLLEEGEIFWNKIQNGIEPEPDGTKGFSEYVAERFKLHTADMIEMPAECAKHIAEYKAARADMKAAEGRKKLAAQEIQLAIGGKQGLLGPNGKPVATWKRRERGSVSYGKLATYLRDVGGLTDLEFDEAKDKFTGEPIRDFRVK